MIASDFLKAAMMSKANRCRVCYDCIHLDINYHNARHNVEKCWKWEEVPGHEVRLQIRALRVRINAILAKGSRTQPSVQRTGMARLAMQLLPHNFVTITKMN